MKFSKLCGQFVCRTCKNKEIGSRLAMRRLPALVATSGRGQWGERGMAGRLQTRQFIDGIGIGHVRFEDGGDGGDRTGEGRCLTGPVEAMRQHSLSAYGIARVTGKDGARVRAGRAASSAMWKCLRTARAHPSGGPHRPGLLRPGPRQEGVGDIPHPRSASLYTWTSQCDARITGGTNEESHETPNRLLPREGMPPKWPSWLSSPQCPP